MKLNYCIVHIFVLILVDIVVSNDDSNLPNEILKKAIAQHQLGQLEESSKLYDAVLHIDPYHAIALHNKGHILHMQGYHEEAKQLVVQAINSTARASFYGTLGSIFQKTGQLTRAKEAFETALSSDVDENWHALNWKMAHLLYHDISNSYIRQRNPNASRLALESAIVHYKESLKGKLKFTHTQKMEILNDMSLALQALHKYEESIIHLKEALLIEPSSLNFHGNLAMAYYKSGNTDLALYHSKEALKISPNDSRIHHNVGNILQSVNNVNEAIFHWKKAIEFNPESTQSLCSLGIHEGDNGNMIEAQQYFLMAANVTLASLKGDDKNPSLLLARDSALLQFCTALLPRIYESSFDILKIRKQYESELNKLLKSSLHLSNPIISIGCGSLGYYLIYQGFNDIDLRRKLALVYTKGSPVLNYIAPHVAKNRNKSIVFDRESNKTKNAELVNNETTLVLSRRLRVGFLSAFFYHHSVGLLTQGVISGISKKKFEVFLIRFPGTEDNVTTFLINNVDHYVILSRQIEQAQKQISKLNLDILIFTEIGMDYHSYFLGFSQLALRTACFWGHAITSGLSTIDYFISSHDFQDSNAQNRYTECLYKMNGLTTAFPVPILPDGSTKRSDFGIHNETLYLVPQTLYKIHPDFDKLIQGILSVDLSGIVMFPVGSKVTLVAQLKNRFKRTLSKHVYDRIKFAPPMNTASFLSLCAIADVVLDPFPVGGGRSSFEIFSVNTPIVMLYPRTSILQLTFAMYKRMSIFDCVAYSDESYINISLRLGKDKEYREKISAKIREKKHVLYESKQAIQEWNYFLEDIARRLPPVENSDNQNAEFYQHKTCYTTSTKRTVSRSIFQVNIYLEDHGRSYSIIAKEGENAFDLTEDFDSRFKTPLEPIKYYFIQTMLLNGINRKLQPVVGTWNIQVQEINKTVDIPVTVHFGDDLALIAQSYILLSPLAVTSTLIQKLTAYLESVVPQSFTPKWIASRNIYEKSNAGKSTVSSSMDSADDLKLDSCITLVLTTCKRLNLFEKTLKSLFETRSSMRNWKKYICQIIVIDDNSSIEDRSRMLKMYPSFEFIFKSPQNRGHAISMNLVIRTVKTRYVFYVEDDWEFVERRIDFISEALAILKRTKEYEFEKISCVLLNDQNGGWYREVQGEYQNSSIQYYFHEYATASANHSFRYWPGFSLNPGIWDLFEIKNNNLRFNENNPLFEREFSIKFWQAGLHVAYLSYETARHIGAPPGSNNSAYVLNGMPRSFDTVG